MDGHEREVEIGEGSGSNPADSVNAQLVKTLTRMTEYFEKQDTRIERLEQPILETADDVALERFQKFNPPRFDGEPNEEKAERWMESLEDIYAALKYTEERKVKFAVFQLEGAARAWWRIVDQKWELENTPRTWENFLSEFKSKFIPLLAQEKKEEEFINLKQGNMTVVQYEAKFIKLSKYAPDMVKTEPKRRRRFYQGLTLEIQSKLVTARLDSYAELVELAQRVEDSLAKLREYQKSQGIIPSNEMIPREHYPQEQTGSRLVRPGRSSHKKPAKRRQDKVLKTRSGLVRCRYCRKPNHRESECWKKAKKCLRCGSSQHQMDGCTVVKEKL